MRADSTRYRERFNLLVISLLEIATQNNHRDRRAFFLSTCNLTMHNDEYYLT